MPDKKDGRASVNVNVSVDGKPMNVNYMSSPQYQALRARQMEIMMSAPDDGELSAEQMSELEALELELERLRNPQ